MASRACLLLLALPVLAACTVKPVATPEPGLDDVKFLSGATADELAQLLDQTPVLGPTPTFKNPGAAEYEDGDPPPVFRWSVGGGPASTLLWFKAPADGQLLRVFTDQTSFAPDKATWRSLSIGTWVTVDILAAHYDAGMIDGDVQQGPSIAFCSMPPGGSE